MTVAEEDARQLVQAGKLVMLGKVAGVVLQIVLGKLAVMMDAMEVAAIARRIKLARKRAPVVLLIAPGKLAEQMTVAEEGVRPLARQAKFAMLG
jgi:hypothetical protein